MTPSTHMSHILQGPDGRTYSRVETRWTAEAEIVLLNFFSVTGDRYADTYAVAVTGRPYHVQTPPLTRFGLNDEAAVDAAIVELCAALPKPMQDLRAFFERLTLPTELALQVAVGAHVQGVWLWEGVPSDVPLPTIGVKPCGEPDAFTRELQAEHYPETCTFEQFAEVFHRQAVQAVYDGQMAVRHREREAQRAAGFATQEDAAAWLHEGLDYVSHGRFAFLDDEEALAAYAEVKEQGCCGFADAEVTVAGRKATVGCCYGH